MYKIYTIDHDGKKCYKKEVYEWWCDANKALVKWNKHERNTYKAKAYIQEFK